MRSRLQKILSLGLIPAFGMLVLLSLCQVRGPFWRSHLHDGEYSFLLSSLRLASAMPVYYTEHPATVFHEFGAAVIRASHPTLLNDALTKKVLSHPEQYLFRMYVCIAVAFFTVVVLLGWIVYSRTKSRMVVVCAQLTPLLAPFALYYMSRVSLQTAASIFSIALIVGTLGFRSLTSSQPRFFAIVVVACIISFGIMNKVTFAPLALVPFFFLKRWQDRALLVALSILFLPLVGFPFFYHWEISTASFFRRLAGVAVYAQPYGTGSVGWVDSHWLKTFFESVIQHEPVYLIVVFVSLIFSGRLLWSRRVLTDIERFFVSLSVTQVVFLAMVTKQPKIQYLCESMILTGIQLGLFLHLGTMHLSSRVRNGLCSLAVLSALGICGKEILWHGSRFEAIDRDHRAIDALLEEYSHCALVYHYGSSKECALNTGNFYAKYVYSEPLKQLYGSPIFYELWGKQYHTWSEAVDIEKLVRKEPCVIQRGIPLEGVSEFPVFMKPVVLAPSSIRSELLYKGTWESLYRLNSSEEKTLLSLADRDGL